MDKNVLKNYKEEVEKELISILHWWQTYMPESKRTGFYGTVSNDNIPDNNAPGGLVMYSRILWTFSAASVHLSNSLLLKMADKAYNYLSLYFKDEAYGGLYWSVTADGIALEDKKQVYGIAFAIYGLTEYYKATKKGESLLWAIELFNLLELNNAPVSGGGYVEAFSRQWKEADDIRLSEKDANEKKSMNTHLHVLEAYTNLYRVWKNDKLKIAIKELLRLFEDHIIDKKTNTQQLFFDENWTPKSNIISYGHDIEASWLLYEAAEVLGDNELQNKWKQIAIFMAQASLDGLDDDGGLWYEKENGHLIAEKHWWPQAEAMVGYLNAYELTRDENFLKQSLKSFDFVKNNLLDKKNGEWKWGIYDNGTYMEKEKAGFWKCPYHNGRSCMEISNRIEKILQ